MPNQSMVSLILRELAGEELVMRNMNNTIINVVRINRTNVAAMVALRADSLLSPRYLHESPEFGYSESSEFPCSSGSNALGRFGQVYQDQQNPTVPTGQGTLAKPASLKRAWHLGTARLATCMSSAIAT